MNEGEALTPLQMLKNLYLCNCLLMFQRALEARSRTSRPAQDRQIQAYISFTQFWFGSLYVVVEGWRALKLKDPKIDALLASENVDGLRLFRNATFHFQAHDLKHQQWFTAERFNWAQALTLEFDRFLNQ